MLLRRQISRNRGRNFGLTSEAPSKSSSLGVDGVFGTHRFRKLDAPIDLWLLGQKRRGGTNVGTSQRPRSAVSRGGGVKGFRRIQTGGDGHDPYPRQGGRCDRARSGVSTGWLGADWPSNYVDDLVGAVIDRDGAVERVGPMDRRVCGGAGDPYDESREDAPCALRHQQAGGVETDQVQPFVSS